MKKGLFTILLAVAVAVGGYWIYFRGATMPMQSMLAQPRGEMEWLRREYHLTDLQFARVMQVHGDYAPHCDAMCAKIAEANTHLNELIKANSKLTAEVQAAFEQCATVQSDCRRALLAHIYAVSAEMSPADGARYLEMMKSRVIEPGVEHGAVFSESAK
jgi:hypothetical protein